MMFGNQSDLEGQFSAKRSASANHDRYRAYNCGLHITNKSNRSQSLALTNNKSYAFLDSVDCKEDNKAYVGHSVVMKCRKNTKAKLDGWVEALEAQLSHKSQECQSLHFVYTKRINNEDFNFNKIKSLASDKTNLAFLIQVVQVGGCNGKKDSEAASTSTLGWQTTFS